MSSKLKTQISCKHHKVGSDRPHLIQKLAVKAHLYSNRLRVYNQLDLGYLYAEMLPKFGHLLTNCLKNQNKT